MPFGMAVLKTIIASVSSIMLLFALAKIMGNKQISQLNMFDYINGITVGSIAAEMALEDKWKDFFLTAVAMAVYGIAGYIISVVTMHSMTARKFLSGEPLVLIENGEIFENNIKKAKLDLDDLLTAARCQGYFSLSEISLAVMETNGRISFKPTENSRPVNLTDLGQETNEKSAPVNLIIDGLFMEKNIQKAGLTIKAVTNSLREQGFKSASEIFLGVLDDGQFCFYRKNNSGRKFDNFA